jgi:hypothetical protein
MAVGGVGGPSQQFAVAVMQKQQAQTKEMGKQAVELIQAATNPAAPAAQPQGGGFHQVA